VAVGVGGRLDRRSRRERTRGVSNSTNRAAFLITRCWAMTAKRGSERRTLPERDRRISKKRLFDVRTGKNGREESLFFACGWGRALTSGK
jgi:hypothetical protein